MTEEQVSKHYKCACPDMHDINSGVVLCTRCNGLKIDITQTELSEGKKEEYQRYLDSLSKEDDKKGT